MPAITAVPNGSLVSKDVRLVTEDGETIEAGGVHKLCRCGRSKEKPFCDDTHKTFSWSTEKDEGRTPDRVDTFEGQDITIQDNRGACSHAGFCTDGLPAVFNNGKEPWIMPDGAPGPEIIETIRRCPSGALRYLIHGELHDSFHDEQEIEVTPAGPFRVRGGPALKDPEGSVPESAEHFALCRCGHSKNKPFCDGTHWYVNFGHRGTPTHAESETEGYVDIGAVEDFEEGKPIAVDADGVALAVFRLWGRVCAVGARHDGADLIGADVTPAGRIVGAGGKGYTPYPWKRAPDDDAPVHDVMVVDGRVWVSAAPVAGPRRAG